jgi:hypothetical protein
MQERWTSGPLLELERHLHLGPVGVDLSVLDLHVELGDFGDAQNSSLVPTSSMTL